MVVWSLAISKAKTEIVCLRTRGMLESTATFRVEAASQVFNQKNESVYLRGDVTMPTCPSRSSRRIRSVSCSFPKYTIELYDRPSALLELKIRMPRAEVLETMLYGCVT